MPTRRGSGRLLPLKRRFPRFGIEGDSIIAQGFSGSALGGWTPTAATTSFVGAWANLNPSVDLKSFAISGSTLGTPSDARSPASTSMWGRSAAVIAYKPTHLFEFIGANDLPVANVATYWAARQAYWAYMKAALPGLFIIVGIPLPKGTLFGTGYTTSNTQKATLAANMRAAVGGGLIDALVPLGEHPVYYADPPVCDPYLDGGGLHPVDPGRAGMLAMLGATLDAIVAQYAGTVPNGLAFTAQNSVELSTRCAASCMIKGLQAGQAVLASATGGDMAFGLSLSTTTSPLALMNGDFLTVGQTSSASYTTATTEVITMGGQSANFTVTTKANVTPVGYTVVAGQTGFPNFGGGSTFTYSNVAIGAGKFIFQVYSDGSTRQPTSFTFTDTTTTTVYSATKIDSTTQVSWWAVDLPGGTYTPKQIAGAANYYVAFQGILCTNCTTVGASQKKVEGSYSNPITLSASQTVGANQLGLVFVMASDAAVTRNDGSTERETMSFNDTNLGTRRMTIATLPSSATPSFSLASGVAVNGAFSITAQP